MKTLQPFKGIKDVMIFTLLYLGVAAVYSFKTNNFEFIMYIFVVLVIAAIAYRINLRVRLTKPLLWCLSIWGLLHMVGGLVHVPSGWPINGESDVFYNLWLIQDRFKYDNLVHMFGFGVTTWAIWQIIQRPLSKIFTLNGVLILCVLAGMGIGSINELVEFLATILIANTNVGGYFNTMMDLVFNTAGSIVAALLIKFLYESKQQIKA